MREMRTPSTCPVFQGFRRRIIAMARAGTPVLKLSDWAARRTKSASVETTHPPSPVEKLFVA